MQVHLDIHVFVHRSNKKMNSTIQSKKRKTYWKFYLLTYAKNKEPMQS